MKNSRTLSHVVLEQIKGATGAALQKYLSLPTEERQKLESNNTNLTHILYDSLVPAVYNTRVQSILVIMEEGIGNMVMLTPTLKMLKHIHPILKITVWGKDPALEVIRGWDCVDNVISEFDYEYYDLCYYSIWSNNVKNNFRELIKQHCKSEFESRFSVNHEIIQQMNLSEFLGGYGNLCSTHCQIENCDIPKEDYIVFGNTTLRNFGWDCKRWPYYEELAKLIYKKFPETKIVLIGDEEDKKDALECKWPESINLDYFSMPIPKLAYLLKNSKLYIGNDTGPTHIAAAVGAKTYAIFMPTLLSKNKPLGKDVTIIRKDLACSPCQYTDKFNTCDCMEHISANDVYNQVFFPNHNSPKKKVLLVGDFSPGALRNERYIKDCLEKEFKFKVIPFEYRPLLKTKSPEDATFTLINKIITENPSYVLICGGQQLSPDIISYASYFTKSKIYNWYVDNRKNIEPWFYELSAVCHKSFWSTGDPKLLSQVFSQTQRPCEFLPITPHDKFYYPMEKEKDIDILFVGTPHSKDRVDLVDAFVESDLNIKVYGDMGKLKWPKNFNAKPGIFDKEFNDLLNRAKIVLNQNIVNDVSLYFSDRYFYPMATKTVGLNQYIPNLEDMFENNKHMVWFNTPEEAVEKARILLKDDKKREEISLHGYALYKEKYKLKYMLEKIFND